MQTLEVKFTPEDGSLSRSIMLRLGDPVSQDVGWSVLVEVVGFDKPYAQLIHGEDWAQAIELAARILPVVLDLRVTEAGGGTVEPSFFSRDSESTDEPESSSMDDEGLQ